MNSPRHRQRNRGQLLAKVAHLARHAAEFGTMTSSVVVDMAIVRRRKREMVECQVAKHLEIYKASGAELIMGSGRFVAPKTLEVSAHGAATRTLTADKIFLNVGTHAAIPSIPGLAEAQPLTHIETLGLDYLPSSGPQLMGREDIDVSQEMRRILTDEGFKMMAGVNFICPIAAGKTAWGLARTTRRSGVSLPQAFVGVAIVSRSTESYERPFLCFLEAILGGTLGAILASVGCSIAPFMPRPQ